MSLFRTRRNRPATRSARSTSRAVARALALAPTQASREEILVIASRR